MQTNTDEISDELIEEFLLKPENFILYRGEGKTNKDGLHFTTNKDWARSFGDNLVVGTLPTNSKIKVIAESDFAEALRRGIYSEQVLWASIFSKGYDAILGHDTMRTTILDIVVHPKHRANFVSQCSPRAL